MVATTHEGRPIGAPVGIEAGRLICSECDGECESKGLDGDVETGTVICAHCRGTGLESCRACCFGHQPATHLDEDGYPCCNACDPPEETSLETALMRTLEVVTEAKAQGLDPREQLRKVGTMVPNLLSRHKSIEAKLDFLIEAARQFAHGACSVGELAQAAIEYSKAAQAPLVRAEPRKTRATPDPWSNK